MRRENEPAAGERNSCGGDKMRNLMFDSNKTKQNKTKNRIEEKDRHTFLILCFFMWCW